MSQPQQRRYLSRRDQANRYNKSLKTIERWSHNAALNMPREFIFNGRPHRAESDLERWERAQVGAGVPDQNSS
jgi:hypothetical protein